MILQSESMSQEEMNFDDPIIEFPKYAIGQLDVYSAQLDIRRISISGYCCCMHGVSTSMVIFHQTDILLCDS